MTGNFIADRRKTYARERETEKKRKREKKKNKEKERDGVSTAILASTYEF